MVATRTARQQQTGTRLTGGLLLLIFVLLATVIVGAAIYYWRHYAQGYRAAVERQLSTVTELKVHELAQWRALRLDQGQRLAQNAAMAALVQRSCAPVADDEARRLLLDWMNHLGAYDRVWLLDREGHPLLTMPAGQPPPSVVLAQHAIAVGREGQVALQDFYRNEQDQRVNLALLVPVGAAAGGPTLGVLVLRIDPEPELYPMILRWPVPSASAETLLVRREGEEVLFLNELRFRSQTALTLRASLTDKALPAVQAALGREGIMTGSDYRGLAVLAATRSVPDSPWALVTKLDLTEVETPLHEQAELLAVLVGGLLLAAAAGVGLVWRQQRVKLYRAAVQAAELLGAAERRYRRLFEAAHEGVLILDASNGSILEVNPFLTQLLGWTHEEFLQRKVWDLGFHHDRLASQRNFAEILRQGYLRYEDLALAGRDGSRHEVEVVCSVFEANRQRLVQCNIRDISERVQALAAIRASEERYRSLFDHMLNGLAYCRVVSAPGEPCDFVYLAVNQAFATLTGLQEVTGKRITEVIPGIQTSDPVLLATYEGVARTGVPQQLEIYVAGLHMWFAIAAYCPAPGHFVAVFDVITKRKEAEAAVLQLNAELEQRVAERTQQLLVANQELESFSYSVSHDLRAPLRHVQGYVDMLTREVGPAVSAKGQRYMDTIVASARDMGELIDDLLAFSRMARQELRATSVPLGPLVAEVVREVQPGGDRQVVWTIPPLPVVLADAAMLKLALINLLGNAVKFTRPRSPARIELGCAGSEGGRLILFVRDNGVGFDPQYVHKLFGVFQRLHRADEFEGTGIGLANVRRIITRHGGRTWAESKLDAGATFFFTLQAAPTKTETHP